MNRFSLTALASRVLSIAILSFVLNACSSSSTVYEEELKKEEYLKSNFPAKKQGERSDAPVKTTFDR